MKLHTLASRFAGRRSIAGMASAQRAEGTATAKSESSPSTHPVRMLKERRSTTSLSASWTPFDTRKMVCAMENAGFTPLQATVLNDLFRETLTEREKDNAENLASRGDYMKVKTELRILEKADFQLLKSDVEHLETTIEKNIASVNTELERIENRVIKYVLLSSSLLTVLGFTMWFFYKNIETFVFPFGFEDDGADGYHPDKSFVEVH